MEVEAVGTDFCKQVDEFDGRFRLSHRTTERVATNRANGPQAEGEFVLRLGLIEVSHL
jgi:hypothetical protein